jgi:hypothetical protein
LIPQRGPSFDSAEPEQELTPPPGGMNMDRTIQERLDALTLIVRQLLAELPDERRKVIAQYIWARAGRASVERDSLLIDLIGDPGR